MISLSLIDLSARADMRPALMTPLAVGALLLDVTPAGSGFVAVGEHGIVLHSEDGRNWQQQAAPVDVMLDRVRFTDDRNGWIAGHDGVLLRSRDGGRNWQLASPTGDDAKPWFDVLFGGATGLLAGADGRLLRTDDDGASWSSVDSAAFEDRPHLYAMCRTQDGLILLVGERGFLARSEDWGRSWTRLKSPYSGSWFAVVADGAQGALIAGLRGRVFRLDSVLRAPALSRLEATAQRERALNPGDATRSSDPVTIVEGWTPVANDDHESLFGIVRTDADAAIVFGAGGRIARVQRDRLQWAPSMTSASLAAGVIDADALIVVGAGGVSRLPLQELP